MRKFAATLSDRVYVVDHNDNEFNMDNIANDFNNNSILTDDDTPSDDEQDNDSIIIRKQTRDDVDGDEDNDKDAIIRRLQQENRELRHSLNTTRVQLEELQEKDRYESTKLIELQDVINCIKHQQQEDTYNSSDGGTDNATSTTNELLIQKSLRVAELSCLVDDLKMESKQLHSENFALKKKQRQYIEYISQIESDQNDRDADISNSNSDDSMITDVSFASTAPTVLTSVSSSSSQEVVDDNKPPSIVDGQQQQPQQSQKQSTPELPADVLLWKKKCESLENSLATIKNQMKDRQKKTAINMKSMQRQISVLQKEKVQALQQTRRRTSSSGGSQSFHQNQSGNAAATTAKMLGRKVVSNLRPFWGNRTNNAKVASAS